MGQVEYKSDLNKTEDTNVPNKSWTQEEEQMEKEEIQDLSKRKDRRHPPGVPHEGTQKFNKIKINNNFKKMEDINISKGNWKGIKLTQEKWPRMKTENEEIKDKNPLNNNSITTTDGNNTTNVSIETQNYRYKWIRYTENRRRRGKWTVPYGYPIPNNKYKENNTNNNQIKMNARRANVGLRPLPYEVCEICSGEHQTNQCPSDYCKICINTTHKTKECNSLKLCQICTGADHRTFLCKTDVAKLLRTKCKYCHRYGHAMLTCKQVTSRRSPRMQKGRIEEEEDT